MARTRYETFYQAINRLEKQVDKIDRQIAARLARTIYHRPGSAYSRIIVQQVKELVGDREAIKRNILQLRKMQVQTIIIETQS